LVPFTVRVKDDPLVVELLGETLLMYETGLLIVKVKAFEVPPPGVELNTVTAAVPALATSVSRMEAFKVVLLTNVVVRLCPFHRTFEVAPKFVPVTFKVNALLPANTLEGVNVVAIGTGLLVAKVSELDAPPPGEGLETVTKAGPAVAVFAAGTIAVTIVLLTNVVVRLAPFHLTTLL
jgi:hypothetical protein